MYRKRGMAIDKIMSVRMAYFSTNDGRCVGDVVKTTTKKITLKTPSGRQITRDKVKHNVVIYNPGIILVPSAVQIEREKRC